MIKLFHILKGWFALKVYADKNTESLSRIRLLECENCVYAKPKKWLKFINGEANEIESLACDKCGCPVIQKSLVREENCPIGKWKN